MPVSFNVIDWCVIPHLLTVCVYAAHASAQTLCCSVLQQFSLTLLSVRVTTPSVSTSGPVIAQVMRTHETVLSATPASLFEHEETLSCSWISFCTLNWIYNDKPFSAVELHHIFLKIKFEMTLICGFNRRIHHRCGSFLVSLEKWLLKIKSLCMELLDSVLTSAALLLLCIKVRWINLSS